jgi:hypothetical protein
MKKSVLSFSIGLLLSSGSSTLYGLDFEEEDVPPDECMQCSQPPSNQDDKPPKPHGQKHPPLTDFGVSEEQVCSLDVNSMIALPPEALGAFDPAQFQCMPSTAFGGMTPAQMQHVSPDTLAQMTPEQFGQLPPQAMNGLHHGNMGNLPPNVIHQMGTTHVGQLNVQEFQQMPSQGIIKIVINLDPALIIPSIIQGLLPEGWNIQEDGTLMPPPLSEIELPPLSQDQTNCVNSPDTMPDLNKGVGLGGQGQSVLIGMNLSIVQSGYPQLMAEQKSDGIVQVTGSGELEGVVIALKPNGKGMMQAGSQTPAGVGVGKGGEFIVTTPEGRQISITPAPKDTCAVSNTLGNGKPIQMAEEGEILLAVPSAEGDKPVPCMFDQFVTPAAPDLPLGLNLPPGGKGQGHFVYQDGTMQQVNPTVHKPARFIEAGLKFEGVEGITHKIDGSLSVKFLGQPLILKPTFKIHQKPLPVDTNELPEPEIEVKDANSLIYSVPEESCGCVLEQEVEIFSDT